LVYHGMDLGPADLGEPRFEVYRERLELMGVHNAIGTGWRAGDRPLGTLVAYDSTRPSGFSDEDLWVLKIAALAAGLVWQHKMAERQLDEARQHEAEFLRAQVERMTELERLKSQFLRLASHELRGPLTVLRGYFDMIMSGTLGPTSPRITPIYPILSAKVQEMAQLVNRMLETARLEDNRLNLLLDQVDVTALVKETVAAIAPLRLNSHRLELNVPSEAICVQGDQQRLGSVLTNLLDNAIKYSPSGGTISVSCNVDAEERTVTVSIADQGIGIDAGDLPRLFSRFGRLVNPDNSHIQGAGLGLYLSREIARMHGGDITINSLRHRGTVVHLSLPLAPVPSEVAGSEVVLS
jgi:signal transduction histidine kinase